MMKRVVLFVFMIFFQGLFAQHGSKAYRGISAPHDHESNNCYGYALGRAEGKLKGDHYCDPEHTHAAGIWSVYPFSTNILDVQAGDILAWGDSFLNNPHGANDPQGHVAYVVSVPANLTYSTIDDIIVDQVPYTGGTEERKSVGEVSPEGPVGFFDVNRGLTMRATFANDFDGLQGGIIWLRNPQMRDDHLYHSKVHPHHEYCSIAGTRHFDIKAENPQTISGETFIFERWNNDGDECSANIEMLDEQISMSVVYEAVFFPQTDPLNVIVSGPSRLDWGVSGVYSVSWTGGVSPYTIRWWYRNDEFILHQLLGSQPDDMTDDDGGIIDAPPAGTWIYMTDKEGLTTFNYNPNWDFSLKCEIEDKYGQKDSDIILVTVGEPGGLRKINPKEETANEIPTDYALHAAYPNPFNPITTIAYDLPEKSDVTLAIFNIQGQEIYRKEWQKQPAGHHSIQWNGSRHASGVYFIRLSTADFTQTRKMSYLK